MSILGFGKKKEEIKEVKNSSSCGVCETEAIENEQPVITIEGSVKVLGSGCSKCNELELNVKNALEQLGMDTTIDHVTDFAQIAAYGVMSTPALVVDGKVVACGKVLKAEEVIEILEKIR